MNIKQAYDILMECMEKIDQIPPKELDEEFDGYLSDAYESLDEAVMRAKTLIELWEVA